MIKVRDGMHFLNDTIPRLFYAILFFCSAIPNLRDGILFFWGAIKIVRNDSIFFNDAIANVGNGTVIFCCPIASVQNGITFFCCAISSIYSNTLFIFSYLEWIVNRLTKCNCWNNLTDVKIVKVAYEPNFRCKWDWWYTCVEEENKWFEYIK